MAYDVVCVWGGQSMEGELEVMQLNETGGRGAGSGRRGAGLPWFR